MNTLRPACRPLDNHFNEERMNFVPETIKEKNVKQLLISKSFQTILGFEAKYVTLFPSIRTAPESVS